MLAIFLKIQFASLHENNSFLPAYCSTFEEHHGIIFNILWEMVVSSNFNMKISAANLLKVLVRIPTFEIYHFE